MKRILCVLLAGALEFNIFGYYVIYMFDRMAIKHEMKVLIHNGFFRDVQEQVTVTDPSHNHDFTRMGKSEFSYRGRMYDIISERYEGSSIVFTCINDHKEEGLTAKYARLSDILNGLHSPAHARHQQLLAAGVIKHALVTSEKEPVIPPCRDFAFSDTCCFPPDEYLSLDTPPPKS